MRRCFSLAVMAAFVQIISGLRAAAWAQGQPITFSALADVPYGSSEYALLRQYVADHNRYSPSAFSIHLGDVMGGACEESKYANVADILKGFAVPAYLVAGDNEYNDCANPTLALSRWRQYFDGFEKNFCGAPATERQSSRSENFAFTLNGVLFIGLNLVGGAVHEQSEWNTRMQNDADWVNQQMQAKVSQVRAAVVFAHAGPEGSPNRDLFFGQFRSAAAAFAKPVLFMQGNTLTYKLDQPWPERNIARLVVPRGTTEPPLEITVTMDSNPLRAFTVKRRPWGTTPFNMPPCVNAGADQTVAANVPITLQGAATDDGDPAGGSLSTTWSQASGPGTAIFGNTSAATTTVSFSATGTYVLSLLADDGQLFKSDEVTITVQGQAATPTISISDLSITEGNSGSVDVLVVATLTNPNGLPSTVVCQVVEGTAKRGSDYEVISGIGTMTFKNGVTTQRVRVTINGDASDEPDETFFVNLFNATNAVIADAQAVCTITNDDGPPTPNAPSNLTANVSGANSITLSWNDNSSDEGGFKIERKTSGGNFSEIIAVGSGVTNFNDTGVSAGVTYVYRIRSYRAAVNSSYSNEATATISALVAPGNLAANPAGASAILLSWSDNSADEDGFKIERKTNNGSFAEIIAVGSDVTTFNDTGVSAGVAYVYRIRAYRAATHSSYSNEATATISTLAAPGNLTASPVGATAIALNWNDNSADEDGFKIERKISGGSFSELIAVGSDVTFFNDTGVNTGVSYVYRIRAYRATIHSSYSNEATASIAAPSAPGSLTASATGTSTIALAWNDNATNEDGFKIERRTGASAFSEIATVSTNTTSYSNSGLSSGTTYIYRVRAYKAAVFSSYSNEASATTTAGNINLARNKTAAAFSTDSDPTKAAANTVDGDAETYWRSGTVSSGAPTGWLSVDLGAATTVSKVIVNWKENYYAQTLSIQVSSNNSTWTAVHGATGSPGVQTFNFSPTSARYVRLYFTKNNKSNYRINEFEIYAGAGALAKFDDPTVSGIENAVPEEFFLEQNYPNPVSLREAAHLGTGIGFNLLRASHVTIKVYALNGAEVATLANGQYAAGRYEVYFFPKNLPSGNYFYVMQTGAARSVRRMTLVR